MGNAHARLRRRRCNSPFLLDSSCFRSQCCASIDAQYITCDPGGTWSRQKQDSFRHTLCVSQSWPRGCILQQRQDALVVEIWARSGRRHGTGRGAIGVDVIHGMVYRRGTCHLIHRCLGCRVRHLEREDERSGAGGDVDNSAPAAPGLIYRLFQELPDSQSHHARSSLHVDRAHTFPELVVLFAESTSAAAIEQQR